MQVVAVTTTEVQPAGPLTQALANLRVSLSQLTALGNLPKAAEPVRSDLIMALESLSVSATAAQQQARDFVGAATPLAAQALTAFNAGQLAQAKTAISGLQLTAQPLTSALTAVTNIVQSSLATVGNNAKTLPGIEADLQNRLNGEQLAFGKAALNDEFMSFGYLAGGDTSMASGFSQTGQSILIALKMETTQIRKLSIDVAQLQTDLTVLALKFQSVANLVGFVAGDLQSVVTDASLATKATIFLLALRSRLAALAADIA